MASRLTKSELIDCTRVNGFKRIETASTRCGYDSDISAFEDVIRQAREHLGIKIHRFQHLVEPQIMEDERVEIAPESLSNL